ncbi:ImmA/IrrE family metallo-endopeptidase [Agromyces sp. NPDC055661]
MDAFSFRHGAMPVILLNTQKSAERLCFDLAHELGHLVMRGGSLHVEACPGRSRRRVHSRRQRYRAPRAVRDAALSARRESDSTYSALPPRSLLTARRACPATTSARTSPGERSCRRPLRAESRVRRSVRQRAGCVRRGSGRRRGRRGSPSRASNGATSCNQRSA